MKRLAACCCGALEIEVNGDPVAHLICHCSDCKQRTGSAFGVSAQFNKSQVTKTTGESVAYKIGDEWGEKSCGQWGEQQRHFCKTCGTTVFWQINAVPDRIVIAGGCFNEPLPEPDQALYVEDAMQWNCLSPTIKLGGQQE